MNGRKDERTDEPASGPEDGLNRRQRARALLQTIAARTIDLIARRRHGTVQTSEEHMARATHNGVVSALLHDEQSTIESRAYCVDRCAVYQPSAARQRGTKVCRYNWHSAGCPGWPFLTLKCYSFSNKIHRSNFIKQHSETGAV